MSLHPVLLEKLNAALLPIAPANVTVRDASLPAVPGKVHAVIGMRRSGKTTFLRQLQVRAPDHGLGKGRNCCFRLVSPHALTRGAYVLARARHRHRHPAVQLS